MRLASALLRWAFILQLSAGLGADAANVIAVFAADSTAPTVSCSLTRAPGVSDSDCAARCAKAGALECAATAFLPPARQCLFSTGRNADFSVEAPDSRAYRVQPGVDVNTAGEPKPFKVIQSRSNGSLSFARTWTEYENGFGDGVDFWIGLKSIHELTDCSPRTLRMEAVRWDNRLFVAEYSGFSVGSAATKYIMDYKEYLSASSNTTSDSLDFNKGRPFSTMDRDSTGSMNCSNTSGGRGGWWYSGCTLCNPNGIYFNHRNTTPGKYYWNGVDGMFSLRSIRLMLLP